MFFRSVLEGAQEVVVGAWTSPAPRLVGKLSTPSPLRELNIKKTMVLQTKFSRTRVNICLILVALFLNMSAIFPG